MNKKIFKRVMGTAMLCTMIVYYTIPVFSFTNEEAVYSKTDVNGKNYKTIVSQIEEDENGRKVNQIDSNKDLPIEYEVTYKLDGKEISAQDVVGKKGRVTISIKYINKDEKQVDINGITQKMYTPFLVVSGVIIDNKNNKNIEINHGKIIENGEKSIAAGFAIPGLIESLKLEDTNIDVCDTIEISMDTENFEIGNIITYATPKAFSSFNIKMSDFDSLFNKVTELQNAANKLVEGTSALNDGIIKIDEGTNTLNKKYSELDNGINQLNNSSADLVNGTNKIANGTKTVSSNLDTISGKLSNAKNGSTQVTAGVTKVSNGVNTITKEVKNQIDIANSEESKTKLQKISSLMSSNTTTISQLSSANVSLNAQLEVATDESVKTNLQTQINTNTKIIELLTGNNSALQSSLDTIKASGTKLGDLYTGLTDLQSGVSQLQEGANGLENGLTLLDNGTSILANKTKELVNGTDGLKTGATKLKAGTTSLAEGSNQVVKGIETLNNGTEELAKGSSELKNGMNQFKTEGIDKVANLINVNGKNLIRRIEKLEELSDNFNTFQDENKKREDIAFINIMDSLENESNTNKDNKKK